METGLECFKEALRLKEADAASYSPLVLAYLGDAVYELAIRTLVVNEGNRQVNKMHKETASLVKAGAQAEFLMQIEEALTPEEKSVYRRGRNAKSFTMAKHATMRDYRMATGFEALMGYLYLTGRLSRMAELLGLGLSRMGKFGEKEAQGADGPADISGGRLEEDAAGPGGVSGGEPGGRIPKQGEREASGEAGLEGGEDIF